MDKGTRWVGALWRADMWVSQQSSEYSSSSLFPLIVLTLLNLMYACTTDSVWPAESGGACTGNSTRCLIIGSPAWLIFVANHLCWPLGSEHVKILENTLQVNLPCRVEHPPSILGLHKNIRAGKCHCEPSPTPIYTEGFRAGKFRSFEVVPYCPWFAH